MRYNVTHNATVQHCKNMSYVIFNKEFDFRLFTVTLYSEFLLTARLLLTYQYTYQECELL